MNDALCPISPAGPTSPSSLAELAPRIIQYDQGVRYAIGRQMGYAYLAGAALNEAKTLCAHGEFGPWCKANLPLTNGTTHRYMEFATQLQIKFPTVVNLKRGGLLPAGELSTEGTDTVLRAVHEAADGRTLTQFYRDLGVIRPAQKQTHHDPRPISPEDQVKADIAAAEATGTHLAGDLVLLAEPTDETLAKMPDAVRARLLDACVAVGKRIRAMRRVHPPKKRTKSRKMSATTSARMRAIVCARWAKVKARKNCGIPLQESKSEINL